MRTTLRTLRDSAELSQSEVAKALGLSASQLVSNWERAKSKPNHDHIEGLSGLYGTGTGEIISAIRATFEEAS